MTFKSAKWFPVAVILTAVNLAGVGYAAGAAEAWHAAIHAALALAFGLWAQRLRQRPSDSEVPARLGAPEVLDALQSLEAEVSQLRQEVSETQERLDFAERVLAKGPESRREDPPR
ncbi:MAG TPA: hypothetical protein VGQ06_02780 [Gemmatimonadales bacterium]|jgi:uncharacterized protein YlxW (UPF0749 family)|nr:hypothetical protein [Gemmatimonadales bacterium]